MRKLFSEFIPDNGKKRMIYLFFALLLGRMLFSLRQQVVVNVLTTRRLMMYSGFYIIHNDLNTVR